MGTADSEIYLASPAIVAASAVAGMIASPESLASYQESKRAPLQFSDSP
jgi:aconitase A